MVEESDRYVESDEQPRWSLNTPIQIYVRDDLPHLAGHSKDISLSGMQIEIGVKLPLNSTITIEIYFQRSSVFDFIEQKPLRIKAKVTWRAPVSAKDYDIWETGIHYLDITSAEKKIILDEIELMESYDS